MTSSGFITTSGGRDVVPAALCSGDIHLEDIAHALAMICRFSGHSRWFYSVAEHSVRVSRLCPPQHRLWGLLHDAPEAYLGDVPGPVKALLPDYRELEAQVTARIGHRFALPERLPLGVIAADRRMLALEKPLLLVPAGAPRPCRTQLACLGPRRAEALFVSEFARIMRADDRTASPPHSDNETPNDPWSEPCADR